MDKLVNEYNSIKTKIESLKVDLIRKQTSLDTLKTQQTTLEKSVLEIANVQSVDEVPAKLLKLEEKIDKLVKEAEELIASV